MPNHAKPLPPLIVLIGPTAVGKTELSLELCRRFAGEIVSADSRLFYRGMDIGTAKPTAAEMAVVPHHLIDVCPPDRTLSVAEYQRMAYAAIDSIHERGRTPFLIGGSALHVRAVVLGLQIPEAPPVPALREHLEAYLAERGREALFARLQALDPATAATIDRQNPRRVLRALEIFLTTGKSKVELEGASPPPYRILQIGLDRERASLYERIDRRVEQMIADGLVAETKRLLEQGYDPRLPALTGLGYREIVAYLNGELSLAEAIERIKVETHGFARRQYTWFRKMADVQWFDMDDGRSVEVIFRLIQDFLSDTPKDKAS